MTFPTTHLSLLRALIQTDGEERSQSAWGKFSGAYEKPIAEWCIRKGVPLRDAPDMAQEIFMILIEKLPSYDPSKGRFRSWLSTVIQNSVISIYHRKERKRGEPVGGDVQKQLLEQLQSREAADELATSVDTYMDPVLVAALNATQTRMDKDHSWYVFEQSIKHERPIADIADELGISKGAAHMAKRRGLNFLKEEYQKRIVAQG